MSDTPRTDFVAHESGDPEWNRFPNRFGRMLAHAQILERELAQKREWVGLTDEEKHDCYLRIDIWSRCVEMVEAKLREKNSC